MLKKVIASLGVSAAVLALAVSVAAPASSQEHEHRGPTIVAPVNGATVSNPVTVAVGFGGNEGPREGQENGEHRRRGGHFFVFVDAPAPEAGMAVPTDATHVPFPEGQRQVTLALPSGQHRLLLVGVNPEGQVGGRAHGSEPITITVQ